MGIITMMIINSGLKTDNLEEYDEFDEWVWTDKDTESVEENIKLKPWDLNLGRGVWSDEDTEIQKEIESYRKRFDDE
jgi:hypothetical protein